MSKNDREHVLELQQQVARLETELAEHRQTVSSLQASEARLGALLDNVAHGIVTLDRSGSFADVNPAFCEMLGYPPEELLGRPFVDLIYPLEGLVTRTALEQLLVGNTTALRRRSSYQHQDGRTIWGDTSGSAIRNADGTISGCNLVIVDITRRQRAEDDLLRSEARYRLLFESAIDAIILLDGERLVDCNPAALQMYGVASKEQLIGRTPFRLSPSRQADGRDSQQSSLEWISLASSGVECSFEWRHQRLDGTPFDTEVNLNPVALADRRLLLAIVRDVSERKQMEMRVRSLIEQTSDALFCYEFNPPVAIDLPLAEQLERLSDCVLVDCNLVYARYYGADSVEQVLGLQLKDLFVGTPESMRRLFQNLIEHDYRVVDGEAVEELADGCQRYFLNNGHGVVEDGKLLRIWGTSREVTDRKLAEQALSLSEERYRLLVSNIPDVTWISNSEGETRFISPNVERVFGYTPQEIYEGGMAIWFERVHPDDRRHLVTAYQDLFGNGQPFDVEYRIQHRNGAWLWLHDRALTSYEEGELRHAYGLFSDITEHKRMEQAELRQRRLAEALRDTAETLSGTLDLEEVLDRIMDKLGRVVEHDAVSIWLAEEERVRPVRTWGWVGEGRSSPEAVQELRSGISMIPILQHVAEGKPWITNDIHNDLDWHESGLQEKFGWLRANLLVPIHLEDRFFGFLSLSKVEAAFFTAEHAEASQGFANQAAIALRNAQLFEMVSSQRAELRRLSARVVEAQEEERRRLSRRLHDEIGQSLTALGIDLNIVHNQLPETISELARSRLAESVRLVTETAGRIRSVMSELRPSVLDDYGLVAALSWYGEELAARTGMDVSTRGEEPEPRLSAATEIALFRVAQEALTNVTRHAEAKQVVMTVETTDDRVLLVISDDGAGFNQQQRDRPPSWGLSIMKERLQAVGGRLQLESQPGKGTRVAAEVQR